MPAPTPSAVHAPRTGKPQVLAPQGLPYREPLIKGTCPTTDNLLPDLRATVRPPGSARRARLGPGRARPSRDRFLRCGPAVYRGSGDTDRSACSCPPPLPAPRVVPEPCLEPFSATSASSAVRAVRRVRPDRHAPASDSHSRYPGAGVAPSERPVARPRRRGNVRGFLGYSGVGAFSRSTPAPGVQ